MELYRKLFEAPEQSKPEDDENKPKPSQTKKADPFDFLHDFDSIGGAPRNIPSGPVNQPDDSADKGEPGDQGAQPSMPRASADDTRSRTSRISASDHMRDMLGRIDQNQDDEIDDAEAARRAGLGGADDAEPETPTTDVDFVRPADVPAILNQQLQAAGEQMPEWHTINNLPGYLQRAIRGMGRQLFGMMTRTPLEQIMTIANVEGQGPNTDAEMRAVAAWLRANGQDRGAVEVGHGMAIPGYQPDVHEYTAMGLRFHVVRDDMGQYIYAYPEQDARNQDTQNRLPGRNVPRLNRESKMTKKNQLSEAKLAKYLSESLASHKQKTLLESQYAEELSEMMLDESTLSKLIGDTPGGQHIVRWMHARHLLSNTAQWNSHPFSKEIMRKEFKSHPDHFMIISASQGVAAIKPYEEDVRRAMQKAEYDGTEFTGEDPTLRYQIVAFRKDEQVDPALLRQPKDVDREADPTVMKARMGMINKKDLRNQNNIFERLWDQIGRPQAIYTTSGITTGLKKKDVKGFVKGSDATDTGQPGGYAPGVEREKIAAKAAAKTAKGRWDAPPLPGRSTGAVPAQDTGESDLTKFRNSLKPIIKPLFKRVGNLAMLDVRDEARDAMEAGSFERAQKWMGVAKKIEAILIAIDKQGDIDVSYGPVANLISSALRDAAADQGVSQYEYPGILNSTPGAEKLKPFMAALKANLIKVAD